MYHCAIAEIRKGRERGSAGGKVRFDSICPMSVTRSFLPVALGAVLAAAAALAADIKGDAARGKELFLTSACVTCHGVTPEDTAKVGPSLYGVMGRKAGTGKSLLGATENLKKYGVTWTPETLDEFLLNPNAKVPGTPMAGILTDPQQRADMIAYLATLKD
jgi:cytochrome c